MERLQNILAHAGVASRRGAAVLIESGVVTVDGIVVREPGARFDEGVQIKVNGKLIAEKRGIAPLSSTSRSVFFRR